MFRAKTVILSITALVISNIACAEDGVMVDLSVLNNLGSSSYYIENEPMFPVLPKRKATPTAKRQTKSKKAPAVKKQATVEAVKVENIKKENIAPLAKKEKEEIVVVDVEPVSHPSPEIKPVTGQDVRREILIEEKILPQVENKPELINNESEKNELFEKTSQENGDIAKETPSEETFNSANQNIKAEEPQAAPALLVGNGLSESAENKLEPENLNSVKFAEDEDELNADNQEKIDEIVGKFKNEKNSKVAIYAYNLDNGVDSFRKKRTCLNRAIEVRSYLLRKGFKNFSIKVINISEKSAKVNTVEIEEL